MESMYLCTQQDGSITCKFCADNTKYAIGHEHNPIPCTSHPHNFCKICPTVVLPSLPWSSKWMSSKTFTHPQSTNSLCIHLRHLLSPLWSAALPDIQSLSCCGNIAPVQPVPMNIQVVFVAVSSFWLFILSVTECQMPKLACILSFQINFPILLVFCLFNCICNFCVFVILKYVQGSDLHEVKECVAKFYFNLTLFWRPLTGGQHLYCVALSGIASAFSVRQ